MKKFKIYSLCLLALGLGLTVGCSDDEDPVEPVDDPVVEDATYTNDAAAILDASCAFSGCHNSGASVGSLEGYADAKQFAEFGRMMPAVNHESGFSPMPKNGAKMSDENIATLQKWVTDGLKE